MTKEIVTAYHSTDLSGFRGIVDSGRVYGRQLLHPPHGYSGGANLTSDRVASQRFIWDYRADGQWRLSDGPPVLLTLTFELPTELVVQVGVTRFFGCPEIATTLTVDVREIPPEYFAHCHAGVFPMSREQAIKAQERGRMRFYQVPLVFLRRIERIRY